MPRSSEIDAIAGAIVDRLRGARSSSRVSDNRNVERRLASAIAYRLRGGRGRGGAESARGPESRISSAVAYRLRTNASRLSSPRSARLNSARSVTRLSSVVADSLAGQRDVRPRVRFSVDAVASAIARRLRYTDATGTFPVAAAASAIARRLRISGGLRGSAALASSIAARLSRSRGGDLALNEEQNPRRG
jgi:hypothetical protein